jgi:hypothetical protein
MALSTRIAVAAFLACLLPTINATVAAATSPPDTTRSVPMVDWSMGCNAGPPTIRPPSWTMACATGEAGVVDIHWKTWGVDNPADRPGLWALEATGSGIAGWDTCGAGDCPHSTPVNVWLGGVVQTRNGLRFTSFSASPTFGGAWSPFVYTESIGDSR